MTIWDNIKQYYVTLPFNRDLSSSKYPERKWGYQWNYTNPQGIRYYLWTQQQQIYCTVIKVWAVETSLLKNFVD